MVQGEGNLNQIGNLQRKIGMLGYEPDMIRHVTYQVEFGLECLCVILFTAVAENCRSAASGK